MKILVVGGTGFIGSAIVRKILAIPGHQVGVLSRHPQTVQGLFGESASAFKGDVTTGAGLIELSSQFDCLIQCVQFPNHPVQNYKKGYTYENYDAKGTENVVAACLNPGSTVKRIIYISGAGTRADRTEPWFRAKIRAESAVKNSPISYVILRPSWVYGPGDHSMNKFVQFAKSLPLMPVIGNGKNRASPFFIDDLARVVSISVESEVVKNRVIELGGPQVLTMNEIQKTVLEVMHKEKPLVHQPLWMAKMAGSVASALLKNPPLSNEAVDFITMDVPVESRPAEELFKMKFVDLKTGLQSYLPTKTKPRFSAGF